MRFTQEAGSSSSIEVLCLPTKSPVNLKLGTTEY